MASGQGDRIRRRDEDARRNGEGAPILADGWADHDVGRVGADLAQAFGE